jgi:hypothetical protein
MEKNYELALTRRLYTVYSATAHGRSMAVSMALGGIACQANGDKEYTSMMLQP